MGCEDSTSHIVGTEEIKKLLRDGDTLVTFFYIHEQLHQGSPLNTELDKEYFDNNIGIIIDRNGTKRFYRLSEYLKNKKKENKRFTFLRRRYRETIFSFLRRRRGDKKWGIF